MKLIVGLGNPGNQYEFTRHNIGFLTLDLYLARIDRRATMKTGSALAAIVTSGREERWFLKPQTFMNRSGEAVSSFAAKKSILPADTLVLHDDADLEPGRIQVKFGGGSGGHNGLESIFDVWGVQDFWRLRIGVGKDPYKELADYVLEPVSVKQMEPLAILAADALAKVLEEGPSKAMNAINIRPTSESV